MRRMLPVVLAMAGVAAAGGVLLFARESQPAHALTNCDVSHAAMDDVELEALVLINAERAKAGLSPLLISETLARAAAWMSEDVVEEGQWNQDHSDSLGRSFGQRIRECGHSGGFNGENLGQAITPAQIVAGWMNSGPHRLNILDERFSYAGLGFYEFVWTIDFSSINSDGTTLPTVPGLSPTATNTPTPTRTPTPTATPTAIVTVVPGRAIIPLVVVE